MIRQSLGRTALAGVLVWVAAQSATAQDASKTQGITTQTLKINELIRKGYEKADIKKSAAKCTDYEFIRRVYIDLLGRIATPEEVIDFEKDLSADKRVKLVVRLLNSEKYQPKKGGQFIPVGKDAAGKKTYLTFDYTAEYSEHWADLWTVWLMTRTGHATYREQMWVWLENQFASNASHKDMVIKLLTATGQVGGAKNGEGWPLKPDYAANFIVHHLGEPVRDDPSTPMNERTRDGAHDCVPITSRVTKLFLGLQTQCTQCHDHPFNKEWVQSDFWGVNAFFRQTVRSATPSGAPLNNNPKNANAALVTLTDDSTLNAEMLVPYERRDGRLLKSFPVMLKDYAQALNGEKSTKILSPAPGKSRRAQLAEWVVSHDNFAKAYVNRIWAHLFGRGLNKDSPAPDDFGSNNEVAHPELLAYLGEEFAKYNYDPKRLLEWICTSDVYSLSHVANAAYVDMKYDPYFARMPLKAMSPEVLFESLMVATKSERKGKDEKQRLRDTWMRKLVRQFGDDEGNELSFNGTVVQALLMMNGSELNGVIGVGRNGNANNVVAEVVKNHTRGGMVNAREMYNELFLLTLNRLPTEAERAKLELVRLQKATIDLGAPTPPLPGSKGTKPPPKGTGRTVIVPGAAATGDYAFYQDVFWALLNTSEFMLNH